MRKVLTLLLPAVLLTTLIPFTHASSIDEAADRLITLVDELPDYTVSELIDYIDERVAQLDLSQSTLQQVDELIETLEQIDGRMLLTLSAPSVHDDYYAPAFDEIVDFHTEYILRVLEHGHDDIRLIVDAATKRYYDDLPEEVIIVANVDDIWMRDFTTVNPDDPVQFTYTRASMPQLASQAVQDSFNDRFLPYGFELKTTNLLLDGGNLVDNYAGRVITTDRFLEDNDLTYDQWVTKLKQLLGATEVAILPPDEELLAHSDGMVSWIDDDVLLVNDYSERPELRDDVLAELEYAFPDVTIIEVPVAYGENAPGEREGFSSACGINLNAVSTNHAIYVPVFDMDHDQGVVDIIRQNTSKEVITIPAAWVCPMGGSVRCLTWQLGGKHARTMMSQ